MRKRQNWMIRAREARRSIDLAASRCPEESRWPLQSKAMLRKLNLPVLQANLSTRTLIFATGQISSSLKRLVALKAQNPETCQNAKRHWCNNR